MKSKEYALAISLAFFIGILLGVTAARWLEKPCIEKICPECRETECPNISIPDCVCNCPESSEPLTEEICSQPRDYQCFPKQALNSSKAAVSEIKVRCSTGNIRTWLCMEQRWQ
jgi:hypothetical protein